MHGLAEATIKEHWKDAWFETWDLHWCGGKGKGKGKGKKKGKGDEARAAYEEQLKDDRNTRNQRWEEKRKGWEQSSLNEKFR